jgi:hypothetical protein
MIAIGAAVEVALGERRGRPAKTAANAANLAEGKTADIAA